MTLFAEPHYGHDIHYDCELITRLFQALSTLEHAYQSGVHDGLEAGPAETIDGHRRDALRDAHSKAHVASDVGRIPRGLDDIA